MLAFYVGHLIGFSLCPIRDGTDTLVPGTFFGHQREVRQIAGHWSSITSASTDRTAKL